MFLKVLWMYNDIMDLYGDKGNIAALKYRTEIRNIKFNIDTATIGDDVDFSEYDIVFIGGGADKEQRILSKDLLRHKDNIIQSIEDGTNYLLICGGYQLFGKYYIDANSNKIEGLGILDYHTESGGVGNRCIGNVIVKPYIDNYNGYIVGFENHGGQTKNVKKPFAKVIVGNGNSFNEMEEGYYDDNIIGTYIHGPILPKNAKLTDHIIKRGLKKRYGDIVLEDVESEFEDNAVKVILSRYLDEKME